MLHESWENPQYAAVPGCSHQRTTLPPCCLQKGYYHRNAHFQEYVDVPHEAFLSGEQVTVDPPHLRMVFNEPVVNSLQQPTGQSSASLLKAPLPNGQALANHQPTEEDSADHHQATQAQSLLHVQGTDSAEGGLLDAQQLNPGGSVTQPALAYQGRHQGDAESQPALADHTASCHPELPSQTEEKLPDSCIDGSNSPHDACGGGCGSIKQQLYPNAKLGTEGLTSSADKEKDWASVLQQSMQAAKNIQWTHKGLQVSWSTLVWLLSAVAAMLQA